MAHTQSIQIPTWLYDQIKAASPGRSFNGVVREALEAWLKAQPATPAVSLP